MLTHPTLERLERLKLTGMAKALSEQMALPETEGLSFLERLGLLVDREVTERESRGVAPVPWTVGVLAFRPQPCTSFRS